MLSIIPINVPYILEVTPIDCDGNNATGLTITYEVRRSTDDVLIFSGSLTEETSGAYTASLTFTEENQYRVFYSTPSDYENGCEKILTEEADFTSIKDILDNILDKLCRVLGLSQSNYRLTDHVYSPDGCLLSANIHIYPTATDLENDTNKIQEYAMTAVYDTNGLLIDYKVVEV